MVGKGGKTWTKNNRGATNAVLCERRARYILDDSKRFAVPKTTVSHEPNSAEDEAAEKTITKPKTEDGSLS